MNNKQFIVGRSLYVFGLALFCILPMLLPYVVLEVEYIVQELMVCVRICNHNSESWQLELRWCDLWQKY
jgi:hypothetical protein